MKRSLSSCVVVVCLFGFGCAEDPDDAATTGAHDTGEETAGENDIPGRCIEPVCARSDVCADRPGTDEECWSDCKAMLDELEAESEACHGAHQELLYCLGNGTCDTWNDYWKGTVDPECTAQEADFRAACTDTATWDEWQ
jgi:hypothetical protein